MKCSRLYEWVEGKIGSVFERWGRVVSRHAWKIILVAILVNGGLGIGMMKLKSDSSSDIYLPQGTRARGDADKVNAIFEDLSGYNYNSLALMDIGAYGAVMVKTRTGNLLTRAALQELQALNDFVLNNTAVASNGSTFTYDNVCARSGGQCSVDGHLFWSAEFLTAVDAGNVSYPEFSYSRGTDNYANNIGGSVVTNPDGTILQSVEYIKLGYAIRTDGDIFTTLAENWVEEFVLRLESYSSAEFDVAYEHYYSVDAELDANISGDIVFFAATIAMMITYACLATLTARITNSVGQRMMLGFAGTLAAGLAILASFGIVAVCGVDFVSIVGVMPFLVIGIGIDDMFILLSGLSGAAGIVGVEGRMAEALRSSGVGITITSITDLLAFLVGSASSFTVVKNFCIYTGISVVFCYLNNITFFAACMAINERRVDGNRHFFTCRRVRTKEELQIEAKPRSHVLCCPGRPPRSRSEAESFADKLPRWLIPKLVLKTPLKIFIVLLFLGYLAAAIYGCIHMSQGLRFTQLVHEDSYFYKFSKWDEDNFARSSPVTFVIDKTYTYSDQQTYALIEDVISTAQSNKYFDSTFEVNWLKYYNNSPYYDGSSEVNFIAGLQNFLGDTRFEVFENDVVIDMANNQITASRVYVMSANLADSQAEGKMMLESRDIADSAPLHCFAYSPYFVVFEQYVAILPQTLQSVGIALAAVFVVTCLFMPHPLLILFVTITVTMIMVGVFGFIYYMDVALSAITMIHLIMSIGFSIDFTAHICHGYMISDGNSRSTRVRGAVDKTGAPIFHGAISSLVGIILLVAAKSYIFRTFAAVMALVLVFGIAHALLLLPVILSWIGPSCTKSGTGTKVDNKYDAKPRVYSNYGVYRLDKDKVKDNHFGRSNPSKGVDYREKTKANSIGDFHENDKTKEHTLEDMTRSQTRMNYKAGAIYGAIYNGGYQFEPERVIDGHLGSTTFLQNVVPLRATQARENHPSFPYLGLDQKWEWTEVKH